MQQTFQRFSLRDFLLVGLPALLLIGGVLWFGFYKLQPAPPTRIVISTGGVSGGYYAYGKRYAEVLAQSGITLEVRTSAGSLENLARLKDPKSGVDLALLQGGTATGAADGGIMSIGRVFYEPAWIFHRPGEKFERIADLRGKRLAVGGAGSGTRALALALLKESGIEAKDATLLPLGGDEAVAALKQSKADAVILVFAAAAPFIKRALADRDLALMSIGQADAYARRLPYLTKVTLPQGVIDLPGNVPPADVSLLAPAAVLAARDDLHPALVYLLAQAAAQIHGGPGLFQAAGTFPMHTDPEFPISDDAVRYYKNGAPLLQRYMPFWLANLVERLIIIGVPAATILFPIFKGLPFLYRWRVRHRILQWYARMKRLESNLDGRPTPAQIRMLQDELDRIEDEVNDSPVPLGFSEQFYDLRGHIDLVRQRLATRIGSLATMP